MADNQGILVFAEVSEGKLLGVAKEGVAVARALAGAAGGEVSAIVIGGGVGEFGAELIAAGADKALTFENAELSSYQPDAYAQVMLQAVEAVSPKVVVLGQTDVGRDLAPKIAFKLGGSLTMDAVNVTMDGGTLQATKPVYGGNAQATYASDAVLHVVAVRVKAFEPLPPDSGRSGSVEALDATVDESAVQVRVTEVKKQKAEGVRLEDANVVVSGGRGFGGPGPFEQLQELADALGGAMGASRAVCDAGWLPHSYQVGLTGKTVTPDLYIAFAISGASQHMAGCSGSKNIVAINKDADANIFQEARYGVVGEWEEILPAFTEMVRELKS